MKCILKYLFPVILLQGCATQNTTGQDYDPGATNYGYHLVELGKGEYKLTFLGEPRTSLEYARKEWNQRAEELCSPLTYTATYTTNKMVYGPDKNSKSRLIDDNAAVGLCVAGGAIGCMLASIFSGSGSSEENVVYPAVEGQINCNKEP